MCLLGFSLGKVLRKETHPGRVSTVFHENEPFCLRSLSISYFIIVIVIINWLSVFYAYYL